MARPLARREEVEPIGQAMACANFTTLSPEQRSLRRSPGLASVIAANAENGGVSVASIEIWAASIRPRDLLRGTAGGADGETYGGLSWI